MVLYNSPEYAAGVALSPGSISVLSGHPNIAAMKNSSTEPTARYIKSDSLRQQLSHTCRQGTALLRGLSRRSGRRDTGCGQLTSRPVQQSIYGISSRETGHGQGAWREACASIMRYLKTVSPESNMQWN